MVHLRMRDSQSRSVYLLQPTEILSQAKFHSDSAAASLPCMLGCTLHTSQSFTNSV